MPAKSIKIKGDWLRSMAYPIVDERQQPQLLLVLDHVGNLVTHPDPLEAPLVVKIPAAFARVVFGEVADTGGAIHGGDLREKTFTFYSTGGGAGVVLTDNGNYEISAPLFGELFEEVAS